MPWTSRCCLLTLAGLGVASLLFAPLAQAGAGPPYVERIADRAGFDALARTYQNGELASLPHLLVVLDRSPGGRLYFVDSKRFAMHRDFVASQYLSLETGREFFIHSYVDAGRRFQLATIAWQASVGRFTVELAEADQATAPLVQELLARLSASFYAPVAFKPNSTVQEAVARTLDPRQTVSAGALYQAKPVRVFGEGRAVGVLRFVEQLTEDTLLRPGEVVVFGESPVTLTPVAGVITTSFSTPLAHVTLLARSWGVPVAYLKGARQRYAPLVGKMVLFEARRGAVQLRAATEAEIAQATRERGSLRLQTPRADLSVDALAPLDALRAGDVVRYGAKAANLGELFASIRDGKVHGAAVPPGIAIPFAWFDEFVQQNGLRSEVESLLTDRSLLLDGAPRRQRLAALRTRMQAGKLDPARAAALVQRVRALLGDKGVFVRSSTNSEDLANFNGAGLYTTVPNVKGDAALLEAVKTVWASVWNVGAFEARERAGVDHRAIQVGVVVQQGMNADAAGVLTTTNPFDSSARHSVYVNAKRGLGIRVVEGRRIPEQLVYDAATQAVRVLTRSEDDTMLTFDEKGGVREVRIDTDRQVLTDAMVKRLASAALDVEKAFGGRPQDIEWLTVGERLYFVQARPFLR